MTRAGGLLFWVLVSTACAQGTLRGTVQVVGTEGRPEPIVDPLVVLVEDVQTPFAPPQPLEIRQRDKQFHPRFLLVPQGALVSFPNDDALDHNVFSLSPVNAFDLGYYGAGIARKVRFEKPGAVRVYCNIHPEMIADVLVVANPHYVRVGSDGKFKIDGVPAGRHTVRAWFALGPSQAKGVDVPATGAADVDFRLQATVVTRAHDNKHGEPYYLDYQR